MILAGIQIWFFVLPLLTGYRIDLKILKFNILSCLILVRKASENLDCILKQQQKDKDVHRGFL